MKVLLMFVGTLILLIIGTRVLIHIIFLAVYELRIKKTRKYTAMMNEQLKREKAEATYNNLSQFDLTNLYRKLLKEDGRTKDLRKAAEIGCRLDLLEEIMIRKGIPIPSY